MPILKMSAVQIAALGLLIIGAVVVYMSGRLYNMITHRQPSEVQLVLVKFAGLLLVVAGMLIIFYAK